MKILLVDDSCAQMKWMFKCLPAELEFVTAEDEDEAMQILSKDCSFNLILMDGSLGFDLYGHEVIKRMRAKGIATRIISFSSDEKLNRIALTAGADSTFNKESFYEKFREDASGDILFEIFKSFL